MMTMMNVKSSDCKLSLIFTLSFYYIDVSEFLPSTLNIYLDSSYKQNSFRL